MKKFTILSLFAACVLFGFNANAQESGDMMIHGGVGFATGPFGSDDSFTGFGGGFEYVFADAMSGTAEYYSYAKDGFSVGVLGIDFKYYFATEAFKAYGKVGFSSASPEVGDGASGINLGVGGIYGFSDNIGAHAGLDYNLAKGDFEDPFGLAIKLGLTYMF